MSFEEALATQAQWVQIWVMWMGIVIAVTVIALLVGNTTRWDAVIVAVTMVGTMIAMQWLYSQVGYVRLLGIVHVALWTPLGLYLWRRLGDPAITAPYRQIIWVFLTTAVISLAFDYADVVRYLMGETASMIP